nr:MAG TPA: hypothetical protein [Caudoviricetes sp.]
MRRLSRYLAYFHPLPCLVFYHGAERRAISPNNHERRSL